MTNAISTGIGVLLILVVGGFVYQQKIARDRARLTSASHGILVQAGAVTLADIAKHADRSSCWSTINGGVYDLTAWIPKHPGGEQAILSICGIDGSARFNAQHGGASLQQKILAGFKIGTVSQ